MSVTRHSGRSPESIKFIARMEDLVQEQVAKKMHLENRQVGVYSNEPITQEQYLLEMNGLEKELETLKKDSRY